MNQPVQKNSIGTIFIAIYHLLFCLQDVQLVHTSNVQTRSNNWEKRQ